jgi:hypothetical protein
LFRAGPAVAVASVNSKVVNWLRVQSLVPITAF